MGPLFGNHVYAYECLHCQVTFDVRRAKVESTPYLTCPFCHQLAQNGSNWPADSGGYHVTARVVQQMADAIAQLTEQVYALQLQVKDRQ